MAQVNIGAIKFNWKGPYNNGTAYVVDDVVSSGGSSYVCILASTGNAVSNGTYWQIMSSAGTDADLLNISSTAQGDIYYNNGSAIARLGAGTSGQALITNGTGANPSWGDVSGGLLQVVYSSTDVNASTQSTSWVDTGLQATITPSSTSSKILVTLNFTVSAESSAGSYSVGALLDRNGTTIGGGSATGRYVNGGFLDYWSAGGYPYQTEKAGYQYLDSPNSTSALTYKLRYASGYDAAGGGTAYFNRNDEDDDHFDNVSSITLMEIGV